MDCPDCGRCPTCGRRDVAPVVIPVPYFPHPYLPPPFAPLSPTVPPVVGNPVRTVTWTVTCSSTGGH